MNKLSILFLVLLYSNHLYSQNINEQLEVKIDNDKFVLIDRYYTSGIFVTYKKDLKKNFLFTKNSDNKIQLNFTLGNEVYTPKDLSSFDVNDFDRPFAGWLFGKVEIGKIKQRSASFVTLETGITGKESLSGKLQVWFHDVLGLDNFTSWTDEIKFKWLFNVKFRYLYNWRINDNTAFQYEILPALGTKDIFLENNIYYFFGKFNELKNSSIINVIDTSNTNEFFGLITIGYKYVAHNTLIEGSIFKNDELFTTKALNHIINLKFGGVYKNKKHTFKLIFSLNSKETPLSISHSFGTFSYSKDF